VFLHTMISDLLDHAKIEAGKMEVRSEPVRIADVVEQVTGAFRPLVIGKGLCMGVSCDDALLEVCTDRQRVEQILTNLLANAVKFTERGRIDVEARISSGPALAASVKGFRALRGSAEELLDLSAASYLTLLVRDTGLGIRDDDLGRLAEDFQQIADAADKYGGTGLGLSISNRLARLLGGQIAVRSRIAEGSTFALVLPILEQPRRTAQMDAQPEARCYAAADGVMV
jgi:signal transduction histidine kinase